MGNTFDTFGRYGRMQEPSEKRPYSPVSKMDFDDTPSTSVEMDPVQDVDGNKKWFKGHTRFGGHGKPFSLKWCKSWITPVTVSCLIAFLVIVVVTQTALLIKYARPTPSDSCVTREQLQEVYRYVNESLLQEQNRQSDHCGCNNSLTIQLQEEVNSNHEQMQLLQSNMLHFNGLVTTVQDNITDMSGQINTLKNSADTLTKKGNSLESDLNSVHGSVSGLTRKVNVLEAYTSNLSAVDHLQNIDDALAHGNISELVMHVRNSVTALSGVQDRVVSQVSTLQGNVSQLGSDLHALQDSVQQQSARAQEIASYSSRLDRMESNVTSLSTKLHSPRHLYDDCRKDTASCTIDPIGRDDYWRECATGYLSINIEGWHTVNYQCEYESASMMNMEALTPFVSDGRVRCDCDITYPGNDNERHRPVPRDIRGVCTLVVTRCPISQTLYN